MKIEDLTEQEIKKYHIVVTDIGDDELKEAQVLCEKERIDPLTKENMFRAGVYCILTAGENYQNLKKVERRLLNAKFDTAESVDGGGKELSDILRNTRFHNNKERMVRGFAKWWLKTPLPSKILDDIPQGRKKEFELRNNLAKFAPGLGLKCSSLFLRMAGYLNVVPIDIWALRYLVGQNFDVTVSDFKTKSGISNKEYFRCEKKFSEIAREKGFHPAMYQVALWCKVSTWTRESKQLDFKFD